MRFVAVERKCLKGFANFHLLCEYPALSGRNFRENATKEIKFTQRQHCASFPRCAACNFSVATTHASWHKVARALYALFNEFFYVTNETKARRANDL